MHKCSDEEADAPRSGPLVLEERIGDSSGSTGADGGAVIYSNAYSALNIQQQRMRLPIFKVCIALIFHF